MCCSCCIPTHSLEWGEFDLPACGPPASFSITPAGSVHKSRGAYVDAVEEMMYVVCVGVTEGE